MPESNLRLTRSQLINLAPPQRLALSAWAEQNLVLPAKLSAEPGRFSLERTPYLREIMDAFTDPSVREITVLSSTQVGKTTLLQAAVGYMIDQAPAPALFVVPTEDDVRGIAGERLRILVDTTPAIARHKTGAANDTRGIVWSFDRMILKLGWSGSDASLAGMPCQVVFLDELGKYRNPRGGLASDRVQLARERTRTFRRTRKIIKTSTPDVESDLINREFLRSDQRRYYVPCPHCGHFAPFVFHREDDGHRFRFADDVRDPEQIRAQRLAWFECRQCTKRIAQDQHKAVMVSRGVWCPEGSTVSLEGRIEGAAAASGHRGFAIWAAYSPFVDWWEIAAEWLTAQGDLELMKSFINDVLGQPWVDRTADVRIEDVRERAVTYELRTVPAEVGLITTGIDVQKDHAWFASRGWCEGERSYLVDWGRVEWAGTQSVELVTALVEASWLKLAPDGKATEAAMQNRLVLIDAGHRRDEVEDVARRYPALVRPTVGRSMRGGAAFRAVQADKDLRGQNIAGGLMLWPFDADTYKNKTARLIATDAAQPGAWFVPTEVGEEYLRQVTAEERLRIYSGGVPREVWRMRRGRRQNHLWDCEVLCTLAADMLGVGRFRFARAPARPPRRERDPSARAEREGADPLGRVSLKRHRERRSGWVNG